LFAEEVSNPGLAIGQGRAEAIERHAALDLCVDLPHERDKILDRARMGVSRVVSGAGNVARHRHAAAERDLEPDPPMAEIWKRHDRITADSQHMFERRARMASCLRSNQSSNSFASATSPAGFVVTFFMA
jgi:hypothetical protein